MTTSTIAEHLIRKALRAAVARALRRAGRLSNVQDEVAYAITVLQMEGTR
jgi:hypothetical protein